MKYIRYTISYGGDAGWRFSNGCEWNSMYYRLLFDSKKWTMESIARAMKRLWGKYWPRSPYHHGFDDHFGYGKQFIVDFVNTNDGVFIDKTYEFRGLSSYIHGADECKYIDGNKIKSESWMLNQCTVNYEYYKS